MRIAAWILTLFLLFNSLADVRADSVFTVGEPHASTLEFRQYFETMSATFGAGTLSIAQNVYEAAHADALWRTVMADWAALCEATGLLPEELTPHTVYVVRSTPMGWSALAAAYTAPPVISKAAAIWRSLPAQPWARRNTGRARDWPAWSPAKPPICRS